MHEENASRDTSLNALNQQLGDLTTQVGQLTVTIAAVATNPTLLKIMTDRFLALNAMVDSVAASISKAAAKNVATPKSVSHYVDLTTPAALSYGALECSPILASHKSPRGKKTLNTLEAPVVVADHEQLNDMTDKGISKLPDGELHLLAVENQIDLESRFPPHMEDADVESDSILLDDEEDDGAVHVDDLAAIRKAHYDACAASGDWSNFPPDGAHLQTQEISASPLQSPARAEKSPSKGKRRRKGSSPSKQKSPGKTKRIRKTVEKPSM